MRTLLLIAIITFPLFSLSQEIDGKKERNKKSELTGPAFDPSGNRLYFSSQKHKNASFTFEVSGPFNEISI